MASSCLSMDPQLLQQLLRGQLSDAQARLVEEHVLHCDCCATALDQLTSQDVLIPPMQDPTPPAPAAEQQVIGGLLKRLQAVRPPLVPCDAPSTGGFAQHDTPSQAAPLEDLTSLLAPAQGPGELGGLGPYRVLKVLGAGGMGVVFEAEDPVLKRSVALKAMKPALASKVENRQRFLREARAAAALEHDHIAAIHHVGEDRGVPFLAMPLLRGESLEARLARQGDLPMAEILRIGREVAAGLAAAHAHGLMHRDIKPANIWLENRDQESGFRSQGSGDRSQERKDSLTPARVKILDFGLARGADDDVALTQSGVIAGTPAYMAPEQARGAPEPRSDLFSLGCVLYRLVTKRLPFEGPNTMAILQALATDQPRSPCTLNPKTPQALSDLIMKLLAKDPQDRPKTTHDVARSLEAIASAEAARDHQRGKRRLRRFLAAAVALLAIGIAGWLYGPTVYRFASNQGVIVIETDDPDVEVTIRGEVVKVLDGKTGQEVTIRAGEYRLELTKGKPGLRLSAKEVALERGGRQIVKVTMGAVAQDPKAPYVVLARGDQTERMCATLAEAVQAARNGEVIEVRGDGPMIREPIFVFGKALTIRAAPGSRPVLHFSSLAAGEGKFFRPGTDAPVLVTDAALVLEGLEIQRVGPTGQKKRRPEWTVVCKKNPLRVANCRFVIATDPGTSALWADDSAFCEVRNCQFVLGEGCQSVDWVCAPVGRMIWENNVMVSRGGANCLYRRRGDELSVRLTHNTFVGPALHFVLELQPQAIEEGKETAPPARVESQGNIFCRSYVLGYYQAPTGKEAFSPSRVEALLQRLVAWQGERNLYGEQADDFLALGDQGKPLQPTRVRRTLADWRQFWGTPEANSLQGTAQFEGGNLWKKENTVPDQLTPGDFRLAAGSAGKGDGPGGTDLGADVDLVGPGPAYERWQKTPAYQQWLKDAAALK